MRRRTQSARWWRTFKAYHPWAQKLEDWLIVAAVVYVVLVIVTMIFTWIQLSPLRSEFMKGEELAHCERISWQEGYDCGGYYDDIVQRRNALLQENGCALLGAWSLDTGHPDPLYTWIAGPICYKPFPFGTLIHVEAGSVW